WLTVIAPPSIYARHLGLGHGRHAGRVPAGGGRGALLPVALPRPAANAVAPARPRLRRPRLHLAHAHGRGHRRQVLLPIPRPPRHPLRAAPLRPDNLRLQHRRLRQHRRRQLHLLLRLCHRQIGLLLLRLCHKHRQIDLLLPLRHQHRPLHLLFLLTRRLGPRHTGIQSFATFANSSAAKDAKTLSNNGTEKAAKPATQPACRGGPGTPASAFFNGQTDGDVDMLNMAFRKGMEEANKFLPTNNTLDAISNRPVPRDFTGDQLKKEEVDRLRMLMFSNGRGRKNRHGVEDLEAEAGRRCKLMMPEQEETGVGEMVEEIMLHGHDIIMKGIEDLHIAMGTEAEKNHRKGTGKAARGRRGASEVDLRTMLIHCAQAVATGDHRGSNELLRQIKQHSSPKGDATQRLAYCFAEGLEARLAGTGSHVYRSLVAKSTSVGEFLRAYKLYMAASSFKKVNFIFVGKIIMDAMVGKSRLHIVDYNVEYGFQWPGLLQMLAEREGGPPEVRITGIDVPQPGFRPAFQIEETGRRLSKCAQEFGVPFKYHGIPAKLETVHAEDLKIDPYEVLIVTSQYGFSNLMDESVIMDRQDIPSPRDMVLTNIRKMRPDVFIDCVVNGTYSAPFFVTRFREALFTYSAQFDMLDATIPRDNDDRLLIERDIFGPCALNVIACEGADRVDRPETYKQWQVRGHRAGLRQVPLSPAVVKLVKDKVKSLYHKDFLIDVDNRWLLQGWKGRVLYAMSTWVAGDHDNSKF
uniref:Uncharacterized protein n=1 Tax=Aegilops tauschii subsp. strangulata TaxID=200361 RepID=A0A453HTT9_AEGTS